MVIKVSDKFPESNLYLYKDGKMEKVITTKIFLDKKIVLFGMPGAFTPTCSNYHVPSITDQMSDFKKKGVDKVFCLVVNDIHVTKLWAEKTGALESGLNFITDPSGKLVKKLELSFNAPEIGFINRSKRFCIILNNLTVEKIFIEEERGICNLTSGYNIFKQI